MTVKDHNEVLEISNRNATRMVHCIAKNTTEKLEEVAYGISECDVLFNLNRPKSRSCNFNTFYHYMYS